ncbi:hypothetical protein GCM10007972_17420 [Iodidimonas muriae]|uniref:Terminase n=1 Tax=Iodidimonas muriae TaxID=261467 RepID=A0ABQ2LDM4_9PROT|nr:hypothetical protein [Iodidimonas muriae]GER08214.1 hypothetical protein JCM17843_25240 [Kordiimonadales bacterium JCM 17843]GGO12437.1 hypothetical protein GCM10007972_17420 [Iodidimonas muriae]
MAAKGLSTRRRRVFLDALRASANVSASARAAGLSRSEIYRLRAKNAEFREDWDHALEEALDDLECELRRRAVEGVEKPVFYAGKPCGSVVNYSDSLGMFLLKSRRPHVFASDSKAASPDGSDEPGETAHGRLESLLARLGTGDEGEQASDDGTVNEGAKE